MSTTISLITDGIRLGGVAEVPADACGLVVLALTAPGGANGPRATYLARLIRAAGLATAVCELTGEAPYEHENAAHRPELLAARLTGWIDELKQRAPVGRLPLGLVGLECAASAALIAAAKRPQVVRAVAAVSGRFELPAELDLRAPALLVAGERDLPAILDNRRAMRHLRCPRRLELISGASHHFQQAGTLVRMAAAVRRWMRRYVHTSGTAAQVIPFARAI